tara:strand:+ start:256 stop:564 length:309 start_codon:yes stop_codon:yes gene_type:complete
MSKKYDKVIIKKSDKPQKKYMAVFTDSDNGKSKTTHFGAAGATDYLQSKEKDRRDRYRSRHKKDLNTRDPTRAGYLSYYILWGDSTSLRTNIASYKKRFGFK